MKKPKIIVNVLNTEYDIVKEVMKKNFRFKLSMEIEGEWDLFWADTGVTNEMLGRMKKYQKINHYPGMGCLARKNNLGKNLMRMRKEFPKEYSFFPPTWLLPYDWKEFKTQFTEKKCKTFIVKPEALSQGKGIFLTRSWENINPIEHYVVQRYIHKPYLMEGLKFDLRIYVLVYGCDPLRIYIFKEGLARLATDAYVPPVNTNLTNFFMHLTNYAINKNSDNFVFNADADKADVGHKRSLTFVWRYVDEHGGDSKELQEKIRDCIVKTLCAVQPQLADSYRSCQPADDKNDKCFEILGFDVLLDHKLKPWLLEVNHSPSFTTDTPFDVKVKAELLSDTVRILNMSPLKRVKFYRQKELDSQNRRMGKTKGPLVHKFTKEERAERKRKHMEKRDKYELERCGSYTRIYPDLDDPNKYANFIERAMKIWEEFFGAKRKQRKSEVLEPPPKPKPVQRKVFPVAVPKKPAAELPISQRNISNKSATIQKQVTEQNELREQKDQHDQRELRDPRLTLSSEKPMERREENTSSSLRMIQPENVRSEPVHRVPCQSINVENSRSSASRYIAPIERPTEHEANVYFPLISKLPAPFQKMRSKGILIRI